jgi:hypothetical protein
MTIQTTEEDTRMVDEVIEKCVAISNELQYVSGNRKYTSFMAGFRGFDITKQLIDTPAMEHAGFVFVTRPRCNMMSSNIKADRVLALLNTLDPQTVNAAIRHMLDTELNKVYPGRIIYDVDMSMFNPENPFIPVLTNNLDTLSGWPDVVVETESTEGGFYGENITYPKGHDQLSRDYELSATFKDMQGNLLAMLLMMWNRWIWTTCLGLTSLYRRDIIKRRMGFSSSIYRFVLDSGKKSIVKWAKATGCYPKIMPIGSFFNYDRNNHAFEPIRDISTSFVVAGKVDYMDPIVLLEFNTLVKRYCPNIESYVILNREEQQEYGIYAIPYINLTDGSNELQWRVEPGILGIDTALL